MNLRRNETQITIRDPFTLCLTFKNSKDYGEPNIELIAIVAGCTEIIQMIGLKMTEEITERPKTVVITISIKTMCDTSYTWHLTR